MLRMGIRATLWAVAGGLLLAVSAVSADRVRLTNGHTIEGIVEDETAEAIVLRVGKGTMRLRRTRIAAIERGTPERHDNLRDNWAEKNFLHRDHVPSALRDLAEAFRKLAAGHAAAEQARLGLRALHRREARHNETRQALSAKLAEASRRLEQADPGKDTAAYNALVRTVNNLGARLTGAARELEEVDDKRAEFHARVASYLAELSAFEQEFRERRAAALTAPDEQTRRFFRGIEKRLAGFLREFREITVPVRRRNGNMLVPVVVDHRHAGTFVLDTGASVMSVTETFAQRMGIDPAALPVRRVTVADGRTVDGRAVRFESVRLGSAEARGIAAVILPDAGGNGPDGLLGMTFLRHFVLRFEPSTGKLVLWEFEE